MKRIFLILLLLAPLSLVAQSTLLEPTHPVYDFLDRMETLGLLDHPLMGSKPLTRARIAELLDEAGAKALVKGIFSDGRFMLSETDLRTLEAFRWEFSADAKRSGRMTLPAPHPDGRSRWGSLNGWMDRNSLFTRTFYRNGLNLYSSESEDFSAYVDPKGAARIIRQDSDSRNIAITSVGFQLRGYVQNKVGLLLDFIDNTEHGRQPYFSRLQLYQDRVGYVADLNRGVPDPGLESANYDIAQFDLALGGKIWELHGARTSLRWGPGRSGQLLLSDWGPPFHQAQFSLNLGQTLHFTYVLGSLKAFPDIADTVYTINGFTRTLDKSKYLAAHRLEWNPHRRLRFAFSEAVVFGERGLELAYLIPVNFYYSAQHDLGDEDNGLMSLEAGWIPHPRWKLYAQLLVDDLTFSKIGSDWYGDKIGWLGGVTWVEPLRLRNLDATLEMAQLRPYIYTHNFPINVYKNWNAPLGYRYGPNSQTIMADLRFRPHRRLGLEASWTNLIHGANPDSLTNAGGDIDRPRLPGDPENAPFLGGLRQTTNRADLSATYEALEHLYLWGRGSWIRLNGEDGWEAEVGFRLN